MIQTFSKFASVKDAEDMIKITANIEDYLKFRKTHPDLLAVLTRFPSLRIPASVLIASLNKLLPRPYSVASVDPKNALVSGKYVPITDILFETVTHDYVTEAGDVRQKKGVCTDFLLNLPIGGQFLTYRSGLTGHFQMPEDPNLPLIMIGAGSGIAPFRAFWQRRFVRQWPKRLVHLYFGCRDESEDLFSKESERCLIRKTAFSRLNGEKFYVQDLLRLDGGMIFDQIVNHKACIFICGKVISNILVIVRSVLGSQPHCYREAVNRYNLFQLG